MAKQIITVRLGGAIVRVVDLDNSVTLALLSRGDRFDWDYAPSFKHIDVTGTQHALERLIAVLDVHWEHGRRDGAPLWHVASAKAASRAIRRTIEQEALPPENE